MGILWQLAIEAWRTPTSQAKVCVRLTAVDDLAAGPDERQTADTNRGSRQSLSMGSDPARMA